MDNHNRFFRACAYDFAPSAAALFRRAAPRRTGRDGIISAQGYNIPSGSPEAEWILFDKLFHVCQFNATGSALRRGGCL